MVIGALLLARYLVIDLGARAPEGRSVVGLLGWDASWYMAITGEGYGALPPEARRFFPLLPLLAEPFSWLLGARYAVLVVANAAALGAGLLLHRLVLQETADRRVADRAVWFLAFAPAAFVLVMGYAESLFMALAVGTVLALRRRKWWWAAAAGALAGLARPVAVALVVAAVVEAARGWRQAPPGERAGRAAATLGPLLGLGAYLLWLEVALGTGTLPVTVQGQQGFRGSLQDPVTRLVQAGRDLAAGDLIGSGLHLPWALVLLGLLVVCARRLPASFTAFAAALVVVALSADNLDSLERYGMSAFPVLIAGALVVRTGWLERAVLGMLGAALGAYALLAFLGAYVP